MHQLHLSGQVIDARLVASHLVAKDADRYKRYGGKDWVISIYNSSYAAVNLSGIASRILEMAIARHSEKVLGELIRQCRDQSLPAESLNTKISQAMFALTYSKKGGDLIHAGVLGKKAEAEYQQYQAGGCEKVLLTSGFADLDRALGGGFERGMTCAIGGYSTMGKTSLSLDIALAQARSGIPVAIFNIEQPAEQLEEQLACKIAGIPIKNLISHQGRSMLSAGQERSLINARLELENLPVFIQDAAGLSVDNIDATLRRWAMIHAQNGGAFYIDYIQLLGTETLELDAITNRFKNLAGELKINCFLLSQFNRDGVNRQDKRPVESDFKMSGQMYQASTYALCPFRPAYFDREAEQLLIRSGRMAEAELHLIKGRRTGKAIIDVLWDYPTTTFHNRAYGSERGGFDD